MLGPVYGLGSGLGGSYQKVSGLPVQVGTLTYNGKSQSVVWSYDSSQFVITEDPGAQIHAGSYEVKFKPVKPYCWPDGTQGVKSFFWTIQPVAISNPVLTASTITYNGSFQSPDITYDSKISENGDTPESVFTTEHLSEKTAGNYTAAWTIKNSDYVWTAPKPATKTAAWTIYKRSVTVPSVSGTDKTYNTTIQGPTVNPVTSSDWTKTDYEGTNAGNYTLTFTLVDPDNTVWSGETHSNPLTFSWSIKPVELVKPTGSPLNFTYSAREQGPYISNGPSTLYVSRTGPLTATNADTYNIVYSFTCNTADITNACWKEDKSTNDVIISYTINKLRIPVPTASFTSVEYSKSAYNPGLSNLSDYSKYLTIDGVQSAADVGTYPVTYSIKSTYNSTVQNVTWEDNTVATRTITWEIVAKKLTKPTLTAYSFTFSPSGITISDYERNVNTDYVIRVSDSSSNLTGFDVGSYSTVYELSCNKSGKINTTWTDGSTDPIILSWQIIKLTLIKPVQISAPNYSSTELTAKWNSNYSEDYMTVTGDKGTNAGTYTATFTTKYPGNAQFGSSNTIQASWVINPLVVQKPTIQGGPFTYDNESHSVKVEGIKTYIGFSGYVSYTGQTSAINAGTYEVTFSLRCNTATVINTKWDDDTTNNFSLTWSIAKAKLPAIAVSESNINLTSSVMSKIITVTREGDGAIIVDNPSTSVITTSVSGNKVTIAVNSQVETTLALTIRVAAGTNYFASTTATEKTVTVVLSDFAVKLAVNSTDIVQSGQLFYENSTLTAEFTGYDPETMTIVGNTGKTAKSYIATIACKTGYVFKDGVSSVEVPWTIEDYLADIPYVAKQDAITLTSKYCNTSQFSTSTKKFGTGSFHCDGNPKHQLVISGFKSATQGYYWSVSFWLARSRESSTDVLDETNIQGYMPIVNLCNRIYICQTGHIAHNMGSTGVKSYATGASHTIKNLTINSSSYATHYNSDIVPQRYFSFYNIVYYDNNYTVTTGGDYVYLVTVYIDGVEYYDFYNKSTSFYGSTYTDKITFNVANCDAYIDDLRIQKYASRVTDATTVPTAARTRSSYTALLMNFDT